MGFRNRIVIAAIVAMTGIGCQDITKQGNEEAPTPRATQTLDPVETTPGSTVVGQPISNLGILKSKVGTSDLNELGYFGQNITIAVLDNGFQGLQEAKGKTLPPELIVEPIYEGEMANSIHGTKMAEVAYAIATGHTTYNPATPAPDMKLFVTNGPYYNLNSSIARLVKMKKQNPKKTIIALYSQIWEYGGNLNGTGYIADLVSFAANSGIVWINAVGNAGPGTYIDEILLEDNGNVQLPAPGNTLEFEVTQPITQLKLVLAWNDFTSDYENHFTKWDLDFQLINSKGKVLADANLIQDGVDHGNAKGYSRHPREQVKAMLSQGTYSIKIKSKHKGESLYKGAKFWVVASGAGIFLKQPSPGTGVLMPAGLTNVIAVGGSDFPFGNYSETKPDVFCPSQIFFETNDENQGMTALEGTSIAAAVCAGALATYASSRRETITRNDISKIAKQSRSGLKKLQVSPY